MFLPLGQGSFSKLDVDYENKLCRKRIRPDAIAPHNGLREIDILSCLQKDRPSVVLELVSAVVFPEIAIITPFYEFGILDYISRQPEGKKTDIVPSFGIDLVRAVAFIHSHGILHRDICANNVVVNTDHKLPRAVLIDFGISWSAKFNYGEASHRLVSDIGTGSNRAPEVLLGCTDYDQSVDLWALGCTIAQINSVRQKPFFECQDSSSDLMLLASIFKTLGTPTLKSWDDASRFQNFSRLQYKHFDPVPWGTLFKSTISPSLCDLVRRTLRYNTRARTPACVLLETISTWRSSSN